MHKHRIPVVLLFAASLPSLSSCGKDNTQFGPEQQFTARERPVEWNTDDRTRLQVRSMGAAMGGSNGMGQGGMDQQGASYSAPTPAGWKQLPSEQFKELHYEVAGSEASCWLTASVGGGLEGNLDRWFRLQMGAQQPAGSLPQAELMGRPASFVEIEGNYLGSKPDYKMLGLITAQGEQCTTLKLVGPKAVVDAEKERFLQLGKAIRQGGGAAMGPVPAAGGGLTATTPPGWKELPAEPALFKDLNYEVAGNASANCYLTASVNGTFESNIERWYQQLGIPVPAGAVAALPKAELMGKQGYLLALDGTYKGNAGFALLGLIAGEGQEFSTLKLVGPKAVVDAEREHFLQLAKSIRQGTAPTGSAPMVGAPGQPAGAGKGPLSAYKVPAGWQEAPSTSSMRLFTFKVGEQTELAVFPPGASSGGLRPNLDRWRDQMQLPAMTDAEFNALAKIEVFGAKVPLLEMRGKFSDGMSGRAIDDAAFLGVVAEQPDGAFFFKFTGPHAEAQAHRQEFLDFCASLRR